MRLEEKLADGLAEMLRLRAFDSAADAFARLVRSNNDRAAATFAVLVNRLERSMTKRENVASDTALRRGCSVRCTIAPARPWWRS